MEKQHETGCQLIHVEPGQLCAKFDIIVMPSLLPVADGWPFMDNQGQHCL